MKPIVIIAIAVVCSIVAVLGIIFGLEMFSIYQAQQEMKNYLDKKDFCEDLWKDIENIMIWRNTNGIHILHPDYEDSAAELMRLDSTMQRECKNLFQAKLLEYGIQTP
jgi:hypothetical protein